MRPDTVKRVVQPEAGGLRGTTVGDMGTSQRRPRYEFRVWGEHRRAHRQLATLAELERQERLDDCYLLVGDRTFNAKIRRNRLKIKRLIGVRHGFQRWVSSHTDLTSWPLLPLDTSDGVRPVFVTKHRRRFRFGSVRAEAAEVDVLGRPGLLRTLAIEGKDLDELVRLRSTLGLAHVPNVALHLAVDPATSEPWSLATRSAASARSSVSVATLSS